MVTDYGGEPSCYKEAMQRVDKLKLELALKSEMASLKKNDTWDLVPLWDGHKVLSCTWVCK